MHVDNIFLFAQIIPVKLVIELSLALVTHPSYTPPAGSKWKCARARGDIARTAVKLCRNIFKPRSLSRIYRFGKPNGYIYELSTASSVYIRRYAHLSSRLASVFFLALYICTYACARVTQPRFKECEGGERQFMEMRCI